MESEACAGRVLGAGVALNARASRPMQVAGSCGQSTSHALVLPTPHSINASSSCTAERRHWRRPVPCRQRRPGPSEAGAVWAHLTASRLELHAVRTALRAGSCTVRRAAVVCIAGGLVGAMAVRDRLTNGCSALPGCRAAEIERRARDCMRMGTIQRRRERACDTAIAAGVIASTCWQRAEAIGAACGRSHFPTIAMQSCRLSAAIQGGLLTQ